MGVSTIIKNLDVNQLLSLFRWFLKHPFFMLATIWATYKTLQIAEREFPKVHNLHNKANAFRHALWNVLIAKYASKFSKDVSKVLDWTETITNWHEEFAPNDALPRLMDLHNNAFGRIMFTRLNKSSNEAIVLSLKEELKQAVLVENQSAFKKHSNYLVYLES